MYKAKIVETILNEDIKDIEAKINEVIKGASEVVSVQPYKIVGIDKGYLIIYKEKKEIL